MALPSVLAVTLLARAASVSVENATCSSNPPFLSFHVHVLFWGKNQTSVDNAMRLKTDFEAHFDQLADCPPDSSALIYPGKGIGPDMAMCFGGTQMGPIGPFLTAQYYIAIGA